MPRKLGPKTRRLLARSTHADALYVSAASAFEIALHTAGRLTFNQPPDPRALGVLQDRLVARDEREVPVTRRHRKDAIETTMWSSWAGAADRSGHHRGKAIGLDYNQALAWTAARNTSFKPAS